jgi:DNA polymerase elongation subunit (family B)|uniref:DNA-directed DNA polymerase n=1 Tax=viral metagenome TaxID=1070528 RepID=A0A6C0AMX6_9ZZZZ
MEKYYKLNLIKIDNDFYKNDIDFQIIEWWAQDEEDEDENDTEEISENDDNKINSSYVIRCFGVTKTGISITCKITNFKPFYYIKVPDTFNRVHLHHFLKYIESGYMLRNFKNPLAKENGKFLSSIVEKKDLFGFRNGKRYKYVKLVFNNYSALMKSRYLFKKAITIENVTKKPTKFKLYESNFEPFMRYCHIKDILMAGWVRLPKGKFKSTQDTSTTQVEVEIDKRDIVSLREYQDMANFLQASWDIEVYSYDRTFPDPKFSVKNNGEIIYPNEIFQIATTYKYTNSSDVLVKHLLTLKRCEPIDNPNVIVEECKNEKELIKRWCEIISKMDPDIFYTYNGDSFDCIYLIERAVLCGLASKKKSGSKTVYSGSILSVLSRLTIKQAEIKEEYFSSSAYGDSKFNRIYIPGRLNYDLLIHYKRGMKKYSSYKLDNIASEILKQNKHDVSAKDMFNLYERGLPEDIKRIGEYCIQDTVLLQKLVDKQLILTNIMQLANVTFVPIGFLTTRGQTIKVFSQILRKARQMDFLVPHTNFNEDSYSITVKMKELDVFTDEDIGQYIEIDLGNVKTADGSKTIRKTINAKVSEVIDETTVIILSDTEIFEEYYNRKLKYRRQEHLVSRLFTNDDETDNSFTGATVLEPVTGMYLDDNIAVLDFASLYPTIMISRNLCYSTFVLDEKYLNSPDVNYETIAWNDNIEYKLKHKCEAIGKSGKTKGEICGKQAYFEIDNKYYCRIHDLNKKSRSSDEKFQKRNVDYKYTIVQPHKDKETGDVVNKGVLPALLEELYAERKRVKREMVKAAADGNKLLESILDSTQLAIKVSLKN